MGFNYCIGNMWRELQSENILSAHSELEDYIKDAKNRVVFLTFFFSSVTIDDEEFFFSFVKKLGAAMV